MSLLLMLRPALASEPLPLVVSATDVAGAAVISRTVQVGQSLELLGFAQPVVEQVAHRARLRQVAREHFQLDMPDSGAGLSLLLAGARLELFVGRPLDPAATELGGYQIGQYPPIADRGPSYRPPSRLIEVRPDNRDRRVSEHFRIGQFLCKQDADWPRFVAVAPALLAKLERLVSLLRAEGLAVETLTVMSGYRTPAYNLALGNVAYSRHVYGDAADVFVDVDGDGQMDDLNQDGVIDVADATWLLDLLERHESVAKEAVPGGLGGYSANAFHGPFLHVDARGSRARWGHQPKRDSVVALRDDS
ncbi:MAG: D-Ala-D-Ala carboxypeptidase family metallohydrolase [Pseudomonadales bacterium]